MKMRWHSVTWFAPTTSLNGCAQCIWSTCMFQSAVLPQHLCSLLSIAIWLAENGMSSTFIIHQHSCTQWTDDLFPQCKLMSWMCISGFRGIKRHNWDIWAKWALPFQSATHIWSSMGHPCYSLFRCASITRHFTKCSRTRSIARWNAMLCYCSI